jgi:hypothetical protein
MRKLILALPLALAACLPATGGGEPGQTPATPGETPDACGASALQSLIGRKESVLETMRFSQPMRVIQPGTMVTMDFQENRVNFNIDDTGFITSVTCG